MKYKDRIQAKRKYKQAILATVTTLTLAVPALAGPASAFAAEKTQPVKTLQQAPKAMESSTATDLINKLLAAGYSEAGQGSEASLENLFRTTITSVSELIPYGGSAISSIISLIWPTSGNEQMTKMVEELSQMMDKKIGDYHLENVRSEGKVLLSDLKEFDGVVNSTNGLIPSSYSQSMTIAKINTIMNKFKDTIARTQLKDHEVGTLPIFTILATARVKFYEVLEKNGKKLGLDDADMKNYVTGKAAQFAKEDKAHVGRTIQKGLEGFRNKVKEEVQKWNGTSPSQELLNRITTAHTGNDVSMELQKMIPGLSDQAKGIRKNIAHILGEKDQFIDETLNNSAFNETMDKALKHAEDAKDGLVKNDDGYTYYYKNGVKQVGLQTVDGKLHYFVEEGSLIQNATKQPTGSMAKASGDTPQMFMTKDGKGGRIDKEGVVTLM